MAKNSPMLKEEKNPTQEKPFPSFWIGQNIFSFSTQQHLSPHPWDPLALTRAKPHHQPCEFWRQEHIDLTLPIEPNSLHKTQEKPFPSFWIARNTFLLDPYTLKEHGQPKIVFKRNNLSTESFTPKLTAKQETSSKT